MGLLWGVALAPVKFLAWTSERILEIAESEYYDEQAIFAELSHLNNDYDAGLVDDETFAAVEDDLMERLAAAQARTQPPAPPDGETMTEQGP